MFGDLRGVQLAGESCLERLRRRCGVLGAVDGATGDGDIGAGLTDGGDGVDLHATGDRERDTGDLSVVEEVLNGVARLGLLVETGVDFDERDTELGDLTGPLDAVLDADQVCDDLLAVLQSCLDCTLDGGITGDAEDGDQVCAGREGDIGLEEACVSSLEVGEDLLVRVRSLDRADGS